MVCSWALLRSAEVSWGVLGSPVVFWALLGFCWDLPGYPDCYPGDSLTVIGSPGLSWAFLGCPGLSWAAGLLFFLFSHEMKNDSRSYWIDECVVWAALGCWAPLLWAAPGLVWVTVGCSRLFSRLLSSSLLSAILLFYSLRDNPAGW